MKKNALIAGMAAAICLSSCDYRDLGDLEILERAEFTLSFQHEKVDSVPAEYRVAFYPVDAKTLENITSGYMLYDFTTGDHKISLPAGKYMVTAWNHDTEHVLTNGYGTRDLVTATTQQYRARGAFETPKVVDSLYHDKTILDWPDYMTHANVEEFSLEAGAGNQVLVLHPDSMVVTVDVNIGGIRGMGDLLEVRGSINNVAGRRYISQENLTEDSVVVMFECQAVPEENRVKAHFHLFGLEPTDSKDLSHKVYLYFWLRTGKVYIPIDVTRLIHSVGRKASRLEIAIEDLNIDLREYITGSSGYEVAVDDWEDIRIGVDL